MEFTFLHFSPYQWAVLAVLVGAVNLVVVILKAPALKASASVGYDPHHPETIPLPTQCHRTVEVPIYSQDRICDDSESGKSRPWFQSLHTLLSFKQ